jgi:hypothetical protein
VKSGYYTQWKHQFGPQANQLALSGGLVVNPVWKTMWKLLKVPSKIIKNCVAGTAWYNPVEEHLGE